MQTIKALARHSTWWLFIKRAAREWLAADVPTLIYMAKAITAAIMALAVSMTLTLPDPRTAIFTTFIVMQPQSGLVFSKSYYRVLGTVAGVAVSLLVVGLFAQDPVWFILCFALWIGATTAAGIKYRNFQSYGFVLAGYTLCIVALPVIEHPLDIFDIATSRFSEVLVGILCATVVSDVIFPRKLTNSLVASERERFVNILATLAKSSSVFDTKADETAQSATFSSGVVGLHAVRINSAFESGADKKSRDFSERLNHEYMNLQTTFHSLKNVITTMETSRSAEAVSTLERIYAPVASALQGLVSIALSADDLRYLTDELLKAKYEVGHLAAAEQKRLKPLLDADGYDAFIASAYLIVRLLDELHAHCHTYLSFLNLRLSGRVSKELSRVVRFSTHTDNLLVALAALRGSGVLLITMMFWILTAWPYATITVTLAVVISLLIGTLPRPLDVAVNFFKGALSAVVVAGIYDFFIVPEFATDLVTFSLVIMPVLGFVAWMTTKPKWSGFSLGFVFLFMSQSPFDLYYKIDPTIFLETTLASLAGIVFAGTAYLLVNFWSCSLTQKRVAKLLRSQLVSLCARPLKIQRGSLESMGRDLVQQFSTQGRLNVRSSRLVFEWLLSTLEIGRAIIIVRTTVKKVDSVFINQKLNLFLEAMQNYFENYKDNDLTIVLKSLKEALEALERIEVDAVLREKIIVELMLMQMLLKNRSALPIIQEDGCR